jgi:hypothetical protein
MNRLERNALCAGVIVLFLTLLFVAGLMGWVAVLCAAVVMGAAITFAWTRFELPAPRMWVIPTVIAVCCGVATALSIVFVRGNVLESLSVPLGVTASFATLRLMHLDRLRCELCNRHLHTQGLIFRCPRCRLQVCEESCWDFESRRCNLCLEQRVPVLPVQESWWLRVSGPRCQQGRCQVCLAAATQSDLRACPHCRRLQCKACWDFGNGDCSRCGEPLPDLPATLSAAVTQITD